MSLAIRDIVSVTNIVRDIVAVQTKERIKWNAVHPSGVTCPRAIWYHMNRPELADVRSWDDLAGLTLVGIILHDRLLPILAEKYAQQGYKTDVEVNVEGVLDGVPIKGRADIVLTNPIDDSKIIVDLKFLHPHAIYRIFHHHIVQVALYAYCVNAKSAFLHYVSRDLLVDKVYSITSEDLEAGIEHARNVLRMANVQTEDELPPPLNPHDFPCLYRTLSGTARCPFYWTCHTETPQASSLPQSITELARRYLEVITQIHEYQSIIEPLEMEKEELEKMLKSYMRDGEVAETELGTVRLIVQKREQIDTSAVRKFFQSINVPPPVKIVEARILQVNTNI